jgi:hypothetical protein
VVARNYISRNRNPFIWRWRSSRAKSHGVRYACLSIMMSVHSFDNVNVINREFASDVGNASNDAIVFSALQTRSVVENKALSQLQMLHSFRTTSHGSLQRSRRYLKATHKFTHLNEAQGRVHSMHHTTAFPSTQRKPMDLLSIG